MANVLDIRRRVKSVKNTQQITKAMKMVSAAKLRRAQDRAVAARPYAERLFDVHGSILKRMPENDGELYRAGEGRKHLLVVVAGDKGLCGPFNSAIFKQAMPWISRKGAENCVVLPIGKKACMFFGKQGLELLPGYPGIFRDVNADIAHEIADTLIKQYRGGAFTGVTILFNKFKSILSQEITFQEVLPLKGSSDEDEVDAGGAEHLAEPSLEGILAELGPKVVHTMVYQALMESCAAEHAARMTAMDAATNNAVDMIARLTLEMNKARQASITKELIEIVSGAQAL